jgi:peptidoglycan/LPS O-acetylase OafA/YrhL
LQAIAFYQTGIFKVFPLNNAYHFILNLLFLQSWGLEAGNSYNSPSWSVSVEVFLYGLFFILCWFNLNKKFFIWIIIFLAIGIETVYSPLGQGIFSFFAGGLVYYIYQNLASARDVKRYTRWIGLLASLSMVVMVADVYLQFIENAALLISHHLIKHFTDVQILKIVEATCHLYLKLIVFPLTILFFGLYETLEGSRGKQLAFIGHISYSSYLIHFPLQLLLMDICDEFKLNIGRLADSGITMMLFYLLLIGISLASFHYFELPVQNYIRKKLIRNKKPVALSIPESAACRVNE